MVGLDIGCHAAIITL